MVTRITIIKSHHIRIIITSSNKRRANLSSKTRRQKDNLRKDNNDGNGKDG
jgi:hypothetical protein